MESKKIVVLCDVIQLKLGKSNVIINYTKSGHYNDKSKLAIKSVTEVNCDIITVLIAFMKLTQISHNLQIHK